MSNVHTYNTLYNNLEWQLGGCISYHILIGELSQFTIKNG